MKYAELTLSGTYRETASMVKGLSAPPTSPVFRLDRFLEQTSRLQRRRRVKQILVVRDVRFSSGLAAGLEAIRRALVRLREHGAELVYYSENYGFEDMFLASACKKRLVHPDGSISFLGVSRTYVFFRKALAKHSVSVEVFRREQYKSAAEMFTEDHVSAAERKQTERYLLTALNRFTTAVSSDMLVTDNEIEALMQGRFFSPAEAVENGWITRIVDLVSYRAELEKDRNKVVRTPRMRGRLEKGRTRIPVLFLEGAIIDGTTNQRSMLSGQAISGQWFASKVAEVRKSRARALVIRINSPGGSATASELIRAEIARTAEKIPVTVSMGPVAASGGYWVASAGQKIFAHKSTITGSIGVVSLYFYLRDFLRKQGITADVVKSGDYADFASTLRKLSSRERQEIDHQIERIYERFIAIVSEARKIEPSRVRDLAGGRIYSGEEALEHGLIDEIGDLPDAVEHAKLCIDARRARVVFGPRVKRSFMERQLQASGAVTSGVWPGIAGPQTLLQELLLTHGRVLALDLQLQAHLFHAE